MSAPKQRYHVRLLLAPVITNDLGEMSEAEVYEFVRQKIDAIAAEKLMSQLRINGSASVEFTTTNGIEARIEVT